jgi:hypothetical protein
MRTRNNQFNVAVGSDAMTTALSPSHVATNNSGLQLTSMEMHLVSEQ